MEVAVAEEALRVLQSSLSELKWRLKHSPRRRLFTDILALCSGMRPAVMVDYGGKMPELQEHLYAFLEFIQKESTIFEQLRLMVIEDMIYLVNVREFAEYIDWSLNSDAKQFFVDLEQDPPRMLTQADKSSAAIELLSVQEIFSSVFTVNGVSNDIFGNQRKDHEDIANSSSAGLTNSQSSEVVDLTSCMQNCEVTIPTLNGWLLGYPAVYLFSKDHISDAIYNLSTKSLRLYRVMVCRNSINGDSSQLEELMSFSVPYDLSMEGPHEPWAKAFMVRIQAKWERCKEVWKSLHMDVCECFPQAIAL